MAYVSPNLAAGINHTSRTILGNFSGGPVVKNQSASTGETGLIPDLGRFYMLRATKPKGSNYCGCVLEPRSHSYGSPCTPETMCNKRSHCGKKPLHHNEE